MLVPATKSSSDLIHLPFVSSHQSRSKWPEAGIVIVTVVIDLLAGLRSSPYQPSNSGRPTDD